VKDPLKYLESSVAMTSAYHTRLMGKFDQSVSNIMKKALRETQTPRAGCSKAESKIFAPPQTPSRERGTAKI